jgi:hypothetical protein
MAVSRKLGHRASQILGFGSVAVAALALSACGSSGPSQEELSHARKTAAKHVHEEVRLRRLEKDLKHLKEGGSGASVVTPTTSGSSAAPVSSSPSSCGGELSVGSVTTCPFAENVEDAYFSNIGSGSGTVEVYSPVTNKYYSMYCTSSPHECTGGNNASVYFP